MHAEGRVHQNASTVGSRDLMQLDTTLGRADVSLRGAEQGQPRVT